MGNMMNILFNQVGDNTIIDLDILNALAPLVAPLVALFAEYKEKILVTPQSQMLVKNLEEVTNSLMTVVTQLATLIKDKVAKPVFNTLCYQLITVKDLLETLLRQLADKFQYVAKKDGSPNFECHMNKMDPETSKKEGKGEKDKVDDEGLQDLYSDDFDKNYYQIDEDNKKPVQFDDIE